MSFLDDILAVSSGQPLSVNPAQVARRLIDTPGKKGGRCTERGHKDWGLDNVGLILAVGAAMGVDLPEPDDFDLSAWLDANFDRVPLSQRKVGDVLGLTYKSRSIVDHVAICGSETTLIHSYLSTPFIQGVYSCHSPVVESWIAPFWEPRVAFCWRFRVPAEIEVAA
jgi:cell wall-associated NlpC family hydrolase